MKYAINCSMTYRELPLYERAAAAVTDGFKAVEFWWPWPETADPSNDQVAAFIDSIASAGVSLVALNFFGGDPERGENGILCHPRRVDEFRSSVKTAVRIATVLGCRLFNASYGYVTCDPTSASKVAIDNLMFATQLTAGIGGTVLIEPLSGNAAYPIQSCEDAIEVIRRVTARGSINIGLLCDFYHLASNGQDLLGLIREHADLISHVQVADFPGRGAPGTGELNFEALMSCLDEYGYQGWVSLEYLAAKGSACALDVLSRLPAPAPKAR